jgi:hypothetical protein
MRIPRRLPVYPMGDDEDFFFGTDNDVNIYWDGTYLTFRGVNAEFNISFATAGRTSIYGGITANDDLYLYANTIDGYSAIQIIGAGNIMFLAEGNTDFYGAGVRYFTFYGDAAVGQISTILNQDIYLAPNGTGYVKFGVRTGTGDVFCNGHLDIKDALGNVVKLMTCA